MKITYIKLVNFKRFPLRDDKVFEKSFKNGLVMVSGPNGAGKSSLFNELTPLPSSKDDFNKGGYKEIHIEHDKSLYILISNFIDKPIFNFIKDGEELNAAGIVTTQRTLVEKYFHTTQITHDLLVGKENFTNLSLLSRKKLFNEITNLNIDKVIEYYNNMKEELKKEETIYKNQLNALKIEEVKLLDSNRESELRSSIANTSAYIEKLMNFRVGLASYKSSVDRPDVIELLSAVKKSKDILEKVYARAYKTISTRSYKSLDAYRVNVSNELTSVASKLNVLLSLLSNIDSKIKDMESTMGFSKNDVLNKISELEKEKESHTSSLKIYKDPTKISTLDQCVMALTSSLPEVISNIPVNIKTNGIYYYSKESYLDIDSEKRKAIDSLATLNKMRLVVADKIDHMLKNEGSMTCPSCNHIWFPEANNMSLEELKTKLKEIDEEIVNRTSIVDDLNTKLDDIRNYIENYRVYTSYIRSTEDHLKDMWDIVRRDQLIQNNPSAILDIIHMTANDVYNLKIISELSRQIEELKGGLEALERSSKLSKEDILRERMDVEETISIEQNRKRELSEEINDIDNLYSKYTRIVELENTLNHYKDEVRTEHINSLIDTIIFTIDTELSKQKVTLIELETELKKHNSVEYTVKLYKEKIKDLEENIKLLKIITDELSPKSGIIAKSISTFINMLIVNMNKTISSIWDYKMEIVKIDVDEDDLNYKFKVNVDDRITIDDVNNVSNGMKEIVNLSFKLVLYKLLNIQGYPLYLDEYGNRLDVSHRSKIFHLIFSLLSNNIYSQIYMITHIDVSMANFRDADVVEL